MKKLLGFGITITTFGCAQAFANVDPKIAEFCLKAQDFQGCVNSMSGKQTEKTTTVRQIQQQGANITEGNSCPAQHVYSGGGYCQRVICVKRGLLGRGHAQDLGGKNISCKGGAELTWDNEHQPVRVSIDERCPAKGLEVGYTNTCRQAEHKGYIELIGFGYDTGRKGLEVTLIYDEPAKSSGLIVGDKVVSLNLLGLSKEETVQKMRKGIEMGDVLILEVERSGRTKKFTLDAAPNRYPLTKTK